MKLALKIILGIVAVAGIGYAGYFFITTNQKGIETFETEKPFTTTIEKKTVATGTVIPEIEIEIKPQISGIVDKLYVEEGDVIKTGDKIAKIKVVPNESALNNARGQVKNAQIVLNNAKIEYDRNKALFDKGIISSQVFNNTELSYNQSKQSLENAISNLKIIKEGTAGGGAANTLIRATVSGTILEIPIEAGDQVIESNNFNPGTTIATIADLSRMIFEGKVDESEVPKLEIGMPLTINLAAIENKNFNAKLRFIAPKGTEENGAVQFKIKGDVVLDGDFYVRAGYSANATMVLDKSIDVLAIREAILQFDNKTDKPYVEIETAPETFERRNIKLGLSDGINVEIDSGLTENDKIKIWNKTEPKKRDSKS
ncbi:efflux RND transporter periplasmic adaptor subunit [Reichenbachiella versicolor]|uniref:efflux RND transporter periplasmic adaptor subunit n=1 Tax=Reichenbachiella versicolor TaxID=1821036 RepID=UPI000D6E4873|nr:efflux RND transporter periplasmic adaptor subunit [Reichenbachiella versicolor]